MSSYAICTKCKNRNVRIIPLLIVGMSAHNAWTWQIMLVTWLCPKKVTAFHPMVKILCSLSQRQKFVNNEGWTRHCWTSACMLVFRLFPHLLSVNGLYMGGFYPHPPLHNTTCHDLNSRWNPVSKQQPPKLLVQSYSARYRPHNMIGSNG